MRSYRPTRPARNAAPQVSRFGAALLAGLAKKTKYVDPALADRWPLLAGEKLAALSRPGRLTGHGSGKTLEIHVPNGAAAAAAQMETDGLITRLGGHFGPGVVTRIAVIQSGRPAAPAPDVAPAGAGRKPEPPADGALGAALSSFRAAVRRRDGENDK